MCIKTNLDITSKSLFSLKICKVMHFSYFSMKNYVVGTHYKRCGKELLVSNHNVCIHREIGKIFTLRSILDLELCEDLPYST